MRVIAGKARGHKLKTIEGLETRPTTDRIKETIFNIIAFDLPECHFLDLFSGSGGIGIEALSRGAAECVFIEQAAGACRCIFENLAHTKLQEGAVIIQKEVFAGLSQLKQEGKQFDIIFLDPPYAAGIGEAVCEKIVEDNLMKKDGYILWERSAKEDRKEMQGLTVIREKRYQTTVITFLAEENTIC